MYLRDSLELVELGVVSGVLLSTLDSGVGVAAGFLVEAQEGVVMGVLVGSRVREVAAGSLVEAQEGIVMGVSVDSEKLPLGLQLTHERELSQVF